jgi:hypothetical protein
MVLSSKEKKSEISSLFSIEVGSTQITDGFKQLRDYYSRLLDDDTELRKEIENNFFCDDHYYTVGFDKERKNLLDKKKKIIQEGLDKFGVDLSEFVEDIINDYNFALFIRGLLGGFSVIDEFQIKRSADFVKIFGLKYRLNPSKMKQYHRLDLIFDHIDFYINNKKTLKYLKDNNKENHIKTIEIIGNKLLNGLTSKESVYCTGSDLKNLSDDSLTSSITNEINLTVVNFFQKISMDLSCHKTNRYGVYYSFVSDKLSFKKDDSQEQLIISNMKFNVLDKKIHEALWSGDKDNFLTYLSKQLLSALKNKIVKLFDYKFNLNQVRDGLVPLILLSDDQINNSLKTSTKLEDLAKVVKNVQDEKQINRLVKALESKLKAGFN